MPANQRPPTGRWLSELSTGKVELEGRMPWSSNATFLVTIRPARGNPGACTPARDHDATQPLVAVYKPGAGERPLWDFPGRLYRREVAAYELSAALGWDLVPETVERPDVPLGPGSLQRFVEADFEQHYFTLLEDERHRRTLKRMATFDVVANNADRKSGHCLLDRDGHIWGIDHGLCFHAEPKLRTVIWDFAGEAIEDEDLEDLSQLASKDLSRLLGSHLLPQEITALKRRVDQLLSTRRLPQPRGERPYPWPLV